MADTVAVDDRDPRISYNGGEWFLAGTSEEFGSTTHGTTTGGASATFKFTGSSVAVYGTISSDSRDNPGHPPSSSYSIDGSNPAIYAAVNKPDTQYKQKFYQSPKLPDGEHTLVITSVIEGGFLWLDYLEFTPAAESTSIPPKPPTVVTTSPPRDPVTSVVVVTSTSKTSPDTSTATFVISLDHSPSQPTTTATISRDQAPNSTKVENTQTPTNLEFNTSKASQTSQAPTISVSNLGVPKGVIAGTVAGGVIFLLAIAILFLVWRRRQRRAPTIINGSMSHTEVSPFMENASLSTMNFRNGQSPIPGHGYVTQGGRSSEKMGMYHQQPPEHFTSHIATSSVHSTGPDPSEPFSSAHSGLSDSHSQRGLIPPLPALSPQRFAPGTAQPPNHRQDFLASMSQHPESLVENPPSYQRF